MPYLGPCGSADSVCVQNASCRTFPGDALWPSKTQWEAFNSSVGGNLIASLPLAAVCHNDALADFDSQACATIQNNWYLPDIHLDSSSSPMAYLFTKNSCNPFVTEGAGCTLGNLIRYAVDVTSTADKRIYRKLSPLLSRTISVWSFAIRATITVASQLGRARLGYGFTTWQQVAIRLGR